MPWSLGHRQFSGVVTRSRTVFGRSQIVTLVAALSTACIGVTTPCALAYVYSKIWGFSTGHTTFVRRTSHSPSERVWYLQLIIPYLVG